MIALKIVFLFLSTTLVTSEVGLDCGDKLYKCINLTSYYVCGFDRPTNTYVTTNVILKCLLPNFFCTPLHRFRACVYNPNMTTTTTSVPPTTPIPPTTPSQECPTETSTETPTEECSTTTPTEECTPTTPTEECSTTTNTTTTTTTTPTTTTAIPCEANTSLTNSTCSDCVIQIKVGGVIYTITVSCDAIIILNPPNNATGNCQSTDVLHANCTGFTSCSQICDPFVYLNINSSSSSLFNISLTTSVNDVIIINSQTSSLSNRLGYGLFDPYINYGY